MSVAGILSSSLFNFNSQSVQSKKQQFQQAFQQLGQDLQSGNLSAAQSDFASLQLQGAAASTTSVAQSNSPIAQAMNQLSTDLQSGNTVAAQQDYAKLQQDFQSAAATHAHGHHHHGGGGSAISQLMDQLGQSLQTGNLSSAQQAYNTLQQDFLQFSPSNGTLAATTAQPSLTGFSVNV